MQIKRVKKQGGFSLIEVMVAVALLAIGLLAIGSGELTVITVNKRTSEKMRAAAAGENIIELMRRNSGNVKTDYANFDTNGTSTGTVNPQAQLDFSDWKTQIQGIALDARGTVTLGARVVDVTPVTVTITWTNGPQNGLVFQTRIS